MQIARARLKLNRYSDIPVFDVTPTEAYMLRKAYEGVVGANPITDIEITGSDDKRTTAEELARLRGRYPALKVTKGKERVDAVDGLFGSDFANLPKTFAEVKFDSVLAKGQIIRNYEPGGAGTSTLPSRPLEEAKPAPATPSAPPIAPAK